MRTNQPLDGTPVSVSGMTNSTRSCGVLQDKEFLRGHYIRFCQMLRKNASVLRNEHPIGKSAGATSLLVPLSVVAMLDGYHTELGLVAIGNSRNPLRRSYSYYLIEKGIFKFTYSDFVLHKMWIPFSRVMGTKKYEKIHSAD